MLHWILHRIQDWDSILLTMHYHDIIYDISKNDNEEKKCNLIKKELYSISFPEKKNFKCKSQILVIKTHLQSNDSDTNLFIDVGLSILGQDWNIYSKYYKKIIFNLYRQREFPRKKKNTKNLSQNLKMWDSHKNLTILELLESSQITKCDGFCRNYCVLLKISKELSCKFFKVLGQVLNYFLGLEKYTKRIFYEKFKNNVRKNLFIELKELNTII
ncbi:Uncharacterized protein GNX_2259 [Leptospira interrogans serovar Canicola]|nr:Uncharacterized protein GNX_2259 [Leptospira interrogans serovar Canicola]